MEKAAVLNGLVIKLALVSTGFILCSNHIFPSRESWHWLFIFFTWGLNLSQGGFFKKRNFATGISYFTIEMSLLPFRMDFILNKMEIMYFYFVLKCQLSLLSLWISMHSLFHSLLSSFLIKTRFIPTAVSIVFHNYVVHHLPGYLLVNAPFWPCGHLWHILAPISLISDWAFLLWAQLSSTLSFHKELQPKPANFFSFVSHARQLSPFATYNLFFFYHHFQSYWYQLWIVLPTNSHVASVIKFITEYTKISSEAFFLSWAHTEMLPGKWMA